MKRSKHKYIVYISLFAIALLFAIYSAVELFTNGSPLLKSMREHIKSANSLHKDSLYDKAIEPYRRALDMEPFGSLVNYNSATNLLMKNYKDIKDNVAEPEIVAGVYRDAQSQFITAVAAEEDKLDIAATRHNNALIYHLCDSLEKAAEEYKEALRNNPADDETRYNLAVVLYQLK
ncbi:MAG: tetratricopeptide repeat protein, partial [Bacteroidaceae bacterium]|nr:tetratricopeptide repeat protein [Bacteroidaceae bacterium]